MKHKKNLFKTSYQKCLSSILSIPGSKICPCLRSYPRSHIFSDRSWWCHKVSKVKKLVSLSSFHNWRRFAAVMRYLTQTFFLKMELRGVMHSKKLTPKKSYFVRSADSCIMSTAWNKISIRNATPASMIYMKNYIKIWKSKGRETRNSRKNRRLKKICHMTWMIIKLLNKRKEVQRF